MRIIQADSQKKLVISYSEWLDLGTRQGWITVADAASLAGHMTSAPSGAVAIFNQLSQGDLDPQELEKLWRMYLAPLENETETAQAAAQMKARLTQAITAGEDQASLAREFAAWAKQIGIDVAGIQEIPSL